MLFAAMAMVLTSGCTSVQSWYNNNFKVGPAYKTHGAPAGEEWLDVGHKRLLPTREHHQDWWVVFDDPVLTELVYAAWQQNLSVRAAFLRIEDARLQRDIQRGNFFPQSQTASGSWTRNQNGQLFFDTWNKGLNMSWELDLWGRLRRQIDAADANLQASDADANAIIVSLIANVASTYIQIRSLDERIRMAEENVTIQQNSYGIADRKFEILKTEIDVKQALSNLEDTKARIPELDRQRRNAINQLAILLGVTPDRMREWVGTSGKLPTIPETLFVGVPCEVVRRRPDIRAAERDLAAQAEQIGIAEADFYPTLSVGGSISVTANQLDDLFTQNSTTASIGPAFQWKILNYGRLKNNVRLQENRFQQALVDYRSVALTAQQEVEDGIIDFLRFHDQLEHQKLSAAAAARTAELGMTQYKEGKTPFNSLFVYQSDLVSKQDSVITTRANIALALINTYKALGGGWQIRSTDKYRWQNDYVPSAAMNVALPEEAPAATKAPPTIQALGFESVAPDQTSMSKPQRTPASPEQPATQPSADWPSLKLFN